MQIEDYLYKYVNFYKNSPKWIREPMGYFYRRIPLSWRYGEKYKEYRNLLKESPYWDNEKKELFILQQLKKTLINAYENTEFYRSQFMTCNFDPHAFKHIKEIEQLPFTSKETLRENKHSLLNPTIARNRLIYVTTGGTSGIPVELYYRKGHERTHEFVFMTEQWKRAGYQFTDRIAVFRGTVVDPKGNYTIFKFDPVKNRLFLSTYDLYEENYPLFVTKIKEFNPHFIHTYPSAVLPLAKYILREGIKIQGVKAVLCSSEQFYPGQRELIEKAFGSRVYSWYGHTEHTTLAGECEHSPYYHIFYEYGYTELIDENNNVITQPGQQGEIVGTSFLLSAFPIIRYRTGDFAEYAGGICSHCGRNYQLLKNVKGRWFQENIITKKDSVISMTALNMHSDLFDHVEQYQFYQKEKGKVDLRIIKGWAYTNLDEKKIVDSFIKKFKNLVDFSLVYVDHIPRTERGKHRFLISEITNSLF